MPCLIRRCGAIFMGWPVDNQSLDRKSSLSRLALGLKKGEASGRDGWRKEFHAAEACFSCRQPFKTVTRQRHHCGR